MSDASHPAMSSSLGIARFGEVHKGQVRTFIEGVVRSTRLWRSERNEVRLELIDHFNDGADAGHSLEQLIQDFGSPKVAARLIRQAKLRNRPWLWRAWNRAFQVTAVTLCVTATVVAFMLARLHLAKSGAVVDTVGELDRVTAKVAVVDRGWPEYREGLLLLDRGPLKSTAKTPALEFDSGVDSPTWNRECEYLDANARSLQLFLKAASRPRLGYVYRDSQNDQWLQLQGQRTALEVYPVHGIRDMILVPHIQELYLVRRLISASALRSLEKHDLPEFKQDVQALAQIGRQLLDESEFLVVRAHAHWAFGSALAAVRRLAMDYPELMSDDELRAFRQDVAKVPTELHESTSAELRRIFEDLLQSTYAPQASGGGRLTATGCAFLRLSLMYNTSPDDPLKWIALLPQRTAAGLPTSLGPDFDQLSTVGEAFKHELTSLRWSATLANREEMRLEFERLLILLQAEFDQPLSLRQDFEGSPYLRELQRLANTPSQLNRYWPVLLTLPTRDYPYWPERSNEILRMQCAGTDATLALEQYRRRTGHWPGRLAELVPADLPQVPLDAHSGRPLIYRLINGKPLLYSVSRDRDDDGGKPYPRQSVGYAPADGDWPLIPVR